MAETKDLALGAYEVTWTLRDHSSFTARIRVYNAGITCLSVTGGSCNQSTPPGVTISGWHVRGYLRSSVAPPPPNKIDKAGIIAEIGKSGAIDLSKVGTRPLNNIWYHIRGILTYEGSGKKITIGNLSTRNPPTGTGDIALFVGWMAQTELDRTWVQGALAKLPYGAAPPPTPPPPPEDTINEAGVLAELRNKGAIDTAQLPRRVLTNTWYYFMGLIAYSLSGYAKWIGLRGNPPTSVELRRNRIVVNELDKTWVMTQLAKLPYGAAPPPTPPPPPEDTINKAGIIAELKPKGAINLSQVSTTSGANKWYYMSRSGYISYTTGQRQITFKNVNTQNPPSGTGNVYLIENRQSVNELDREWVLTQLAKLPYGAAPPPTPPPPPEDTINEAGVLAELRNKGAIDTAQLPRRVLTNTWYYFMGLIAYSLSGYAKWIGLRGNPPTSVELRRNRIVVNELDKTWVMTQLAKLPYGAAPPPTPPPPPEDTINKAGIIAELKPKGAINLSQVSTTSGANKWYYMSRSGYISYTTGQRQITFKNVNTQNPPSGTGNVYLIENRQSVNELDREWVLTQLAKLPYGAAPPPTPPPPPEDTINEAGVLAELRNKGAIDTAQLPRRVLTNTWYYFMGLIAYSLSGYAKWIGLRGNPPTSVELRRNRIVVNELDKTWVMAQLSKLPYGAAPPPPPPPPPEGLKEWIDGVDVHKLTKDHAKYIWFVSRGRTSDANELRNRLSPKPAEMQTEAATRTNAKGVWFYSKGRFTDGNALLDLNYG